MHGDKSMLLGDKILLIDGWDGRLLNSKIQSGGGFLPVNFCDKLVVWCDRY